MQNLTNFSDKIYDPFKNFKNGVSIYNYEGLHIYILLLSLNVVQVSTSITNIFTYITLVAFCTMSRCQPTLLYSATYKSKVKSNL